MKNNWLVQVVIVFVALVGAISSMIYLATVFTDKPTIERLKEGLSEVKESVDGSLTINRTSPNETMLPDPNPEPTIAPGTRFINIDIDSIHYNVIFLQSTNRIWCLETPTGVKLIKVPR